MDGLLRPPQPWSGIAPHLAPHNADSAYSTGRSQYLQHQRQLDDTLSWTYSGGIHPGYAASPQMAAMGPLGAALLAPWPALARDGFGSALGYGGLQISAWAGQGSSGAESRAHNQGWMLSMGGDAAQLELGYMDERGALDSSGGGALGLGSGSNLVCGRQDAAQYGIRMARPSGRLGRGNRCRRRWRNRQPARTHQLQCQRRHHQRSPWRHPGPAHPSTPAHRTGPCTTCNG